MSKGFPLLRGFTLISTRVFRIRNIRASFETIQKSRKNNCSKTRFILRTLQHLQSHTLSTTNIFYNKVNFEFYLAIEYDIKPQERYSNYSN